MGWEIKFTATEVRRQEWLQVIACETKTRRGGSRGLSGGKTGVRLESAGLESLKHVTYPEDQTGRGRQGAPPAPGNQLEPWWMKHSVAKA